MHESGFGHPGAAEAEVPEACQSLEVDQARIRDPAAGEVELLKAPQSPEVHQGRGLSGSPPLPNLQSGLSSRNTVDSFEHRYTLTLRQ